MLVGNAHLLRVPPATHDLAIEQGFTYGPINEPPGSTRFERCSQCDQPIYRTEWCYRLTLICANDFWCVSCIEFKLPAFVASGRALR